MFSSFISATAEIPLEQQLLINLNNQVKNNELSIDDAVEQFKAMKLQAERRDLSFKTQSVSQASTTIDIDNIGLSHKSSYHV